MRHDKHAMEMSCVTPISTRFSGHHGASVPPRTGGGDDGCGRDGDGFIPDFIPNYGERLRRARMGLAVAMTPIIVLFVSFTTIYLIRRGILSLIRTMQLTFELGFRSDCRGRCHWSTPPY